MVLIFFFLFFFLLLLIIFPLLVFSSNIFAGFVFSFPFFFFPFLFLQASLGASVCSVRGLAELVDPSDDQCSSFRKKDLFFPLLFSPTIFYCLQNQLRSGKKDLPASKDTVPPYFLRGSDFP